MRILSNVEAGIRAIGPPSTPLYHNKFRKSLWIGSQKTLLTLECVPDLFSQAASFACSPKSIVVLGTLKVNLGESSRCGCWGGRGRGGCCNDCAWCAHGHNLWGSFDNDGFSCALVRLLNSCLFLCFGGKISLLGAWQAGRSISS